MIGTVLGIIGGVILGVAIVGGLIIGVICLVGDPHNHIGL
jgi:hypothetical protein